MSAIDSSLKLIAAFVTFALGSVAVDAAEIRADPSRKGIGAVLEGRIEAGDLAKLRRFILDGDGAEEVYLASPGGDLAEAMNIGRLVRALKLETVVPSRVSTEELHAKVAARHNLREPKAHYMCASACFFIFVAGIHRREDAAGGAILGIHRPYLSDDDLRTLSSDQAMLAGNRTRMAVERYLKEMGVPAKYVDRMFSVPRDEVQWISRTAFESDFEGFIPELRDWVAARCDRRTALERKVWKELENKTRAQLSTAERLINDAIMKKFEEQVKCEIDVQSELARRAYIDELERRDGRTPQ